MILDRKLAALVAQPSQTEAFRTVAGDDYYRRVTSSERFGRFSRKWEPERRPPAHCYWQVM
jgi:hypothetical protein